MNLFSLNWWISAFINTLITMCFIYIIKVAAANWSVPVVSTVAEAV